MPKKRVFQYKTQLLLKATDYGKYVDSYNVENHIQPQLRNGR